MDMERDMACAAVGAFIRARSPDFAVLFPRHRFGFVYNTGHLGVTVHPKVAKGIGLLDALNRTSFQRAARKVGAGFYEVRWLADHLLSVARDGGHGYGRTIPNIEPLGIEAADPRRVRVVLSRARHLIYDEPSAYEPPPSAKPWIKPIG